MKILTQKKRDLVRFIIKKAMNDLKVAKEMAFKAYGSHELSRDLSGACIWLEDAIKNLPRTKPKPPKAAAETSPADSLGDGPAKSEGCPMQKEPTAKKAEESDIDERFREVVCDQLFVRPEDCVPQARFVEDLGADDMDPAELAWALEEEFQLPDNICFTEEEVGGFTTYEKLLNLVKEKLRRTKTTATCQTTCKELTKRGRQ